MDFVNVSVIFEQHSDR